MRRRPTNAASSRRWDAISRAASSCCWSWATESTRASRRWLHTSSGRPAWTSRWHWSRWPSSVGKAVTDAVLRKHGGCVSDAMRDLGISKWLSCRLRRR